VALGTKSAIYDCFVWFERQRHLSNDDRPNKNDENNYNNNEFYYGIHITNLVCNFKIKFLNVSI